MLWNKIARFVDIESPEEAEGIGIDDCCPICGEIYPPVAVEWAGALGESWPSKLKYWCPEHGFWVLADF